MEIRKLMEEMKDVLFILLVTAFFTWIANCIQLPKVNMAESSIGVLLLVVITAFGILVSHLPGFRILPMVFGYRSSQWLSRCRASRAATGSSTIRSR